MEIESNRKSSALKNTVRNNMNRSSSVYLLEI